MFLNRPPIVLILLTYLKTSSQQCPSPPFKDEAQILLKIFGYSASCTTAALDACELGCRSDFASEFLVAEKSIAEAHFAVEKALSSLKSMTRCFRKLRQHDARGQHCSHLREMGDMESGVRIIYPYSDCPDHSVPVYCDQKTSNGGWTVIQRRENLPIREDFNRNWTEYENGFGKLTGEFWLGLKSIHELTSLEQMMLRIELEDKQGEKRFAHYDNFKLGDASTKYELINVGTYSGNANDSLTDHVGSKFSTTDSDNDDNFGVNRAKLFRSAWWFDSMFSNLNGFPYKGKTIHYGDGIKWSRWLENESLSRVEMKIRPIEQKKRNL